MVRLSLSQEVRVAVWASCARVYCAAVDVSVTLPAASCARMVRVYWVLGVKSVKV